MAAARRQESDYWPPMTEAVPLGIQCLPAMSTGNITVPLHIASPRRDRTT